MAYITTSWGRPIQGISQQPDRVRMEGQCTRQVNFQPDVVKGLTRRTSTRHVAVLGGESPQLSKHHSYDRGDEAYYMRVTPNSSSVAVWDLLGRPMVVNGTDAYLSVPSPEVQLDFHTVGDFTFITNRTVGVRVSDEKSPVESKTGIIYLQYATYGRTYTIRGDGEVLAEWTTQDGSDASQSPSVQTNYLTERLYKMIVGGTIKGQGGDADGTYVAKPGWSAELHDNVIFLWKTDGSDYKLETVDSQAGADLKSIKGSIKTPSDLPPKAPEGYVVRITGAGKSTKDDYWVKAHNTNDSVVTWRETVQPGVPVGFDAATMPHVLIRESVDSSGIATFTLKAADWAKREVGGDESNPLPDFIDVDNPTPIQSVGTFQNRLFFLSGEFWFAGRSGLFFNMWRESGQAVIDTDPLSGYADTDQVNNLYNYQLLNGDLVLFSDRAQFLIKGDKPVTKATLTLQQITAYPNNIKVEPQAAGENLFFAFDAAGYTGIRELFTDNYSDTKKAFPITDYVSRYIVGSCNQLLSSPNYNTLYIRSPSNEKKIWAYNWIWQAEQKVQSAWHEWEFEGDVEHIFFVKDRLYAISNMSGNCFMHYLFMVNEPDDENLSFSSCLDHKVKVTAQYDADSNHWKFKVPYNYSRPVKVVQVSGYFYLIGAELEYSLEGDYVVLKDRLADKGVNVELLVGIPYTSEYIPTNPVVKDVRDRVIGLDKIILQGIYIHYEETGYLRATVKPANWPESSYEFHGRYMGTDANLIGAMDRENGTYRVPIRGRADNLSFLISSDSPYPMTIRDMECNGTFHQRGQRI